MSTPNPVPNEQDQLNAIRQSLINTLMGHYTNLTSFIKNLPIHQQLPGLLKGLSYIDDGLLWAKEVLLAAPLIFPEKKEENTPDVKPTETAPKQQENLAE
jgi:hypothetical protein